MSDRAMKYSRQIPAQQGWFVLSVLFDETGFPVGADQEIIVAWAFEDGDELSVPYPVTRAGVHTGDPLILTPAGVVDSVSYGSAPTLFSWLEDIQADHRSKNGGR